MAWPALKRQAVEYIVSHYSVPRRRACGIIRQHRSTNYYRSRKDPQIGLRTRMRELARARVRYGYRRLHVLLKREGWSLGRNQAFRIYREEELQLRSKKPRRRKMVVARRERYVPKRPNQAWSMDFVADQLVSGIVATRDAPARIFVDNGSEFSGRLFDLWAYHQKAQIDFSRPGKPTDNCFIESFNGSFRDECLNVNWFETIDEAKEKIEAWQVDYNESRPHEALKSMAPSEYALKCRATESSYGSTTAKD